MSVTIDELVAAGLVTKERGEELEQIKASMKCAEVVSGILASLEHDRARRVLVTAAVLSGVLDVEIDEGWRIVEGEHTDPPVTPRAVPGGGWVCGRCASLLTQEGFDRYMERGRCQFCAELGQAEVAVLAARNRGKSDG